MSTETSNLTINDVRAAVGEASPNATNAGALRKILGRGSLSTIQKHLDTIRHALAAPAPDMAGTAPEAPKELVQALWSAAWTAAQAKTAGALATAQALAAQQAAALVVTQADAAAAQADVDSITEALAAAQADVEVQCEVVQGYVQQVEALRKELAQQAQQHAQEMAQAQQAAQLATVHAQAVEATLRGEIDRQISQLADLRAALGGSGKVKAKLEQSSLV